MPGHRERYRRVLSAEQYILVTAGTTSVCQGAKALFQILTPTPSAAALAAWRHGTRYYQVTVKFVLIIFGALSASAAQAQNAPWCLQSSPDGSLHCTYAAFQQCLGQR